MPVGPSFASPRALGGIVQWAVEIALGVRGGGDDTAIWQPDADGALWDTKGQWSGFQPSWVDITSRVLSAGTRRGRDRWEQEFKAGTARVFLDNQDGIFNPDAPRPPGAVDLRPGRWLRVLARTSGAPPIVNGDAFVLTSTDGLVSGITTPNVAIPAAGYSVRFQGQMADLPRTADAPMINQYSANGANRVFELQRRLDDVVRFIASHDDQSQTTVAIAGFDPDAELSVETTVDYQAKLITLVVNGQTQLGQIPQAVTGPNTSTVPLAVGRRGGSLESGRWWAGSVQLAQVLDVTGQTILADLDPDDPGTVGNINGAQWNDQLGKQWTAGLGVAVDGTIIDPNVWIPVWTGQIDTMEDRYTKGAAGIDSMFGCIDFGARFQIDDPPALETPIPAGQLTSDRVQLVLDDAGWPDLPEWRDIDTGEHTMGESALAQSRWQELQAAATAEGGAVFINPAGVPTFRNRDWLVDKLDQPPVLAVGNVGADVQVLTADTDWSQQRVYNDVQMARVGGTVYRVVDETSISLYGRRTYRRLDLQCQTDSQVQAIADRFLAAQRFDRSRLESVDLVPVTAQGVADLLALELGDLVRVTIRTLGEGTWTYTGDYFVNGIAHQVDASDWVTSLRIDAADFDVPLLPAAFTDAFTEAFDSQDPQ